MARLPPLQRNDGGEGWGGEVRFKGSPPPHEPSVAQVGNLLYRRLVVGRAPAPSERLRIANPRYSRLPVCATVQGFNALNWVSGNSRASPSLHEERMEGGNPRLFEAQRLVKIFRLKNFVARLHVCQDNGFTCPVIC